jgi:hypothetical protein
MKREHRKRRLMPAGLAVFGLLAFASPTVAADYFLDSQGGDDARDGRGQATAWQTLERASAATLKPGDRVLLRGGRTFRGTLRLDADDAGTAERPVIVASYGEGRATIEAGTGHAVLVSNAGGVEVRDLICAGMDRTKNQGAGVAFVNSLPGNQKLRHVRIGNIEARGFGRELPKPKSLPEGYQLPQGAGILVGGNPSDGSKSGFEDVEISGCVCHDNAYYGILITGAWDPKSTNFANANVRIRDCRVFQNPGDPLYHENHSGSGILVEDCDGGVVERCVAYENGALCNDAPGGPCGIWAAIARRVVIRECESFGNRTSCADGDGFDLDGGCIECVLEYNYSHDNDGAGFLVYTYGGAPHTDRDNVVRWNVSENDARRNRQYGGICLGNSGKGMTGVRVYHNTVIMSRTNDLADCVVAVENAGINVAFWNNLFIATGGIPIARLGAVSTNVTFQGNGYAGAGSAIARAGTNLVSGFEAWRALGMERVDHQDAGFQFVPSLDVGAPRGLAGDLARLASLGVFRPLPGTPEARPGLDLGSLFGVDVGERDWSGRPLPAGVVSGAGALAASSNGVFFHVANDGSDAAGGSSSGPFATLARAQKAARDAVRARPDQAVTVWLRGGTYELPQPLVFGPEDTAEAPVSYRALSGERVVVSGGARISGWKAESAERWSAEVPGVKEGRWYPRQLFINGERRTRARTPNEGFLRGLRSEDARRIGFPAGTLHRWNNLEDIELITFVEWTTSRARLGKLDAAANVVEFPARIIQFFTEEWGQHIRGNLRNFPFYFENALELLDAPGEWYLDRHTGQLTYWPRPGEQIETAEAVLPRLEQLVVVRGSSHQPVRNLHFLGIAFAQTDWPLPKDGFFPDQAGFFDTDNSKKGLPVPAAALDFHYTRGCSLEDCRVIGAGGHAIRFGEGCRSNTISGCTIESIGGNGISLGLFDRAASEAEEVQGNTISNCVIRRCGLDYAGCVGIWVGIARETRILQNELAELPYAGISCGWSWDRREVGCRDNVIERNHIHQVARLLADTGGIYALGDQPGGVLRGNYIHDIKRYSGLASVNGLFFDNGSRGWRVEDNVIHDVSDGAIRHNDNRHEDQSWGTNYLDIKPETLPAAAGRARQAGPIEK